MRNGEDSNLLYAVVKQSPRYQTCDHHSVCKDNKFFTHTVQ